MTTLREAAQMALDALEHGLPIIEDFGGKEQIQIHHKAIAALYDALREALAQPEPEPVAWYDVEHGEAETVFSSQRPPWEGDWKPLYTAPPQQLEQKPVATLFGSLPVYDVPPKQEPVAWRTFDGEGGYEFRSYEMNENYAEDWAQRNPNHKGWVEPLYKDPTPCQTCESLARTVMMDQTSHDTAPPQRKFIGLTDEEIEDACWTEVDQRMRSFARAIEAKLKEKNNG